VTCPALDARPCHSDEEHNERERDGHTGNVQHVAERIVRRRLVERLWLLNDGDEHHTSGAAASSKLLAWKAGVNRVLVVGVR
jgi:hypothetical protein